MPSAERILRDNKSASDSLNVGNSNRVLYEYTMFGNGVTTKVNLLERSCSCQKFDLVKISCKHVMTALREKYGDGKDYGNSIYDYSSPIYKAESYLLVYSKAINVTPSEVEWTVPQELVDTKISPPPYDPKLGRKKFKRTKGFGETFKSKRRNREQHAFVGGKENIFMPSAERILRDNKSASDSLNVGNSNRVLYEYTMFGNGVTTKVNLLERSCSCQKFDLVKISCKHVMTALREKYGDGKDYGNSIYDYSSPIYKAESYLLVYSKAINVTPSEVEWTVPQELVDTKISPPPYDPKLGRKKFKRTKGFGETFKSKRRNRCSICKKSGHKRTTCRMGIKS
ncbi:hypothetical protein BC332_31179 [Capsicum chinense]|nr:hypothetical protein BC332_31179 [Capsicum chinense]